MTKVYFIFEEDDFVKTCREAYPKSRFANEKRPVICEAEKGRVWSPFAVIGSDSEYVLYNQKPCLTLNHDKIIYFEIRGITRTDIILRMDALNLSDAERANVEKSHAEYKRHRLNCLIQHHPFKPAAASMTPDGLTKEATRNTMVQLEEVKPEPERQKPADYKEKADKAIAPQDSTTHREFCEGATPQTTHQKGTPWSVKNSLDPDSRAAFDRGALTGGMCRKEFHVHTADFIQPPPAMAPTPDATAHVISRARRPRTAADSLDPTAREFFDGGRSRLLNTRGLGSA